jgi:23S rRNA A1618 N6-methylase RlmF
MKGEYNNLISTAMDMSGSYPKGRTACFDIGISGNCIGNCLLCRAFEDDFDGIKYDYIQIKKEKNK